MGILMPLETWGRLFYIPLWHESVLDISCLNHVTQAGVCVCMYVRTYSKQATSHVPVLIFHSFKSHAIMVLYLAKTCLIEYVLDPQPPSKQGQQCQQDSHLLLASTTPAM